MSEPPGYGAGAPGDGRPAPNNGLGTAALVLGIIGLVLTVVLFFFPFLGLVLGIVAVVLGYQGRGRARRQEATNGGAALAGIITGAIAVVLAGIIIVIGVLVLQSDEFDNLSDCLEDAGGDEQAEEDCAEEFREELDP